MAGKHQRTIRVAGLEAIHNIAGLNSRHSNHLPSAPLYQREERMTTRVPGEREEAQVIYWRGVLMGS